MTLTNEHKVAFLTIGYLLQYERKALLENHTINEINALCTDINTYISPLIDAEGDLIGPVIAALQDAIDQAKRSNT